MARLAAGTVNVTMRGVVAGVLWGKNFTVSGAAAAGFAAGVRTGDEHYRLGPLFPGGDFDELEAAGVALEGVIRVLALTVRQVEVEREEIDGVLAERALGGGVGGGGEDVSALAED